MRALTILAALTAAALTLPAQAQWTLQHSPTTAGLRGIDNVGNGIAWASGTNGTILRTTDTGKTWQRCTTPPNADHLDFRGIQAFDANTAIVMSSGPGNLSRLYKTTDGCQTWKLLFTNPDADGFFDALQLPANRTFRAKSLLLLGDPVQLHFRIWYVNPFSTASKFVHPLRFLPFTFNVGEAAFAASNSSLFAIDTKYDFSLGTGGPAGASVIRARVNSGECRYTPYCYTYSKVPVGDHTASSGVFSIAFSYETKRRHGFPLRFPDGSRIVHRTGVIVGGDYLKPNDSTGTAAFTTDGGRHWQAAITQPHGFRSTVAYDSKTKTWITVGPNGTDISTDDGRNWRALHPTPSEAPDADRNWNALSLPYAVGPHGRIGILNPSALKPTPTKP